MRSRLALGTALAIALVAPVALPCGAPFGNGINVDPQQDIVVVHKNGVETYVFQPRFCGSAKEFGLILPIPAKLTSQPALSKAEIFSYLASFSAPTYTTVTMCAGRGVGGSGGGTGWAGGGDAGIGVVSSGTVGFMDYSQLETSSVGALTAWLDANGYPYDSLAQAAFQYYVDKGWYFIAFKINQGGGGGGGIGGSTSAGTSICKDLGPVKLSFPTDTPVVPTRMAGARAKDTTGSLSYYNGFSWHVYGITPGAQQIGFAAGATSNRVLNFSGLLTADVVSHLDGLAVAGDRADKLTLTFNYGSTDPDVALADMAGVDYREVIQNIVYVPCDAGVDSAIAPPPDAPVDLPRVVDAGVPVDTAITVDAAVPQRLDAAVVVIPPEAPWDASVPNLPEVGKSDSAVVLLADAAPVVTPDAAVVAKADAAVVPQPDARHEQPVEHSSGCSVAGGVGDVAPLVMIATLLGLARRRRR